MYWRRRNSHWGLFFKVIWVTIGLVAIWISTLFYFTSGLPKSGLSKYQKSDAIVVLTGGSQRLDEGLKLLQDNMAERLFVSGVYKGIEVRTLLKIYNQKQTDFGRRVFVGGAQNTRENALETSKVFLEMLIFFAKEKINDKFS